MALLGLDLKTLRRYVQVAEQCRVRLEDGLAGLTDERIGAVNIALKAVEGRWQNVPQGEVVWLSRWRPRLMLVGLATAIGLGVLLCASPLRWPVVVLLSLVTFTAFAWAPRPWLTRSNWRALRWISATL